MKSDSKNTENIPTYGMYCMKDRMIDELKSVQHKKKCEIDFNVQLLFTISVCNEIINFDKEKQLRHIVPISWTRYFKFYMGINKSLHKGWN